MTKAEFVKMIFQTPCEKCPISIYCKMCVAITCCQVARKYYSTHKTKLEVVYYGEDWRIKI